ncbi:hypothetical protein [Paraburkholderia xenovorans]|jgi:hypothetical protein|nr:hypothetical protein [Paraburkholderia xenovorans]
MAAAVSVIPGIGQLGDPQRGQPMKLRRERGKKNDIPKTLLL